MSGVENTRSDQPKNILVSVWEPAIDLLNRRIKAACLRRDEFLDRILVHEAKMLALEVTTPNSDRAREYLANELGKMQRKPVNLRLHAETVRVIRESCDAVNAPRDAFFNRVFLLLVAKRPSFEKLLSGIDWRWATERLLDDYWNYFEPSLDSALTALQEIVQCDPFRFYRACIELANRDIDRKPGNEEMHIPSLHNAFVSGDFFTGPRTPKSTIGFNCYVPDWRLPSPTQEGHLAESLENVL